MDKKPTLKDLLSDEPLPIPDGMIIETSKIKLEEFNDKVTTFNYDGATYRVPTWFAKRLAILAIRQGVKKVKVRRPVKSIRGGRTVKTYVVEKLE